MKMSDLRPAKDFAVQYGMKAIIYGPPGSGKTPVVNTSPRPVLLACEPGLLSMRNSNVPTYCGYTAREIDDFFSWVFNSTESKNFDTIAIDSITQMAEHYLIQAEKTNKHGLAAYGEMSNRTMAQLDGLYFTKYKHTYLICKEAATEANRIMVRKPYFPGRELPIKVPHRYDAILRLATHNVPGRGTIKAFRCVGSIDEDARDRTGSLAEFEPPDFGLLVQKAMQNG